MSDSYLANTAVVDPAHIGFYADVVAGLAQRPKRLPCKYFYDRRGSQLFEAICRLDEYYLTRTELAIMRRYAGQIADQIGPDAMLIELGSGSSTKTRLLLDHLKEPAAYVPVDISGSHLKATAGRLRSDYRHIDIMPVCTDFTSDFEVPRPRRTPSRRTVYFPGSTIGNFVPEAATALLGQMAAISGRGGGLLIGIDLQKDAAVIEAAYNDSAGITAKFNLNLLRRINRELDADFDLDAFRHLAFYDDRHQRVDIRLVSLYEQRVRIGEHIIEFASGEAIHTEYSHKYTVDGFARLAGRVGLVLHRCWTDPRQYFGVLHFIHVDRSEQ